MRRLVTAMLAAAVLAGCSYSFSTGGSDTLDPDEVEAHISEQMKKQQPNLPVSSVTCPDGIKPVQGRTFECTVDVDGAKWPIGVTITQVDVGTETVTYDIKHTKALLIPEGIVNALKRGLREQGVQDAKVDCGTERFRVVEVGGAIECTVTAGGEQRVVRAVAEADGGVHFEED
jgi:Domain of unknown function (DUF4333)